MFQKTKHTAFSLIEVIVAVALFAIFAAFSLQVLLAAAFDVDNSADQVIASAYLQEAEEATHSIRDYDWGNLSSGTHGLSSSSGYWALSGSSDTFDKFTRTLAFTTVDADRYDVVTTVSWTTDEQVSRSISSTFRIADTQSGGSMADNLSVNALLPTLSGGNTVVNGITITNIGGDDIVIAEMTATWVGGGPGNKISDITINGSSVWSRTASSGRSVDISDFTLISGAGVYPINSLTFTKTMLGSVIEIEFLMSDGSTKTVSGIIPL